MDNGIKRVTKMTATCDVLRKVVKFTVFSENHIERILELTTEPVNKPKLKVTGKVSELNLKSRASKKLIKFLEKEGYDVTYTLAQGRRGKKELAGLVVDVKPRRHTKYSSGVVVSCLAEGITEKELDTRVWKIEETLWDYFTKNGIPVDRICKESVLGCEYKFY